LRGARKVAEMTERGRDDLRATENAQKTPLNDLLAASTKAKETIAAACPKETAETTTVQLAVIERRVAALLDALKIVRPAYNKFYTSLGGQQKARLDALGPGRHGWRW
jgi:hypothetical protein